MATILAAQLAQIAAKSSNPLDLKAQKRAHSKSLLFDQSVAATQDFDNIYQICLEGYQELCQMDKRFIKFARTIFSEQSRTEERAQLTAAQNKDLDEVLESFLWLVSARILLRPALKAIEWLIRRFRVHEENTLCLVLTFLPYHTMPVFATLLSILPKNLPPALKFLHPYSESCVCPPRHSVVYTAIHNHTFFASLNNYTLSVSRAGYHYSALLSFWATIATEAVVGLIDQSVSGRRESQRQKESDVLLQILPILNEGLAMRQVPDLRVGCYMILTVLASKMELQDRVLTSMIKAVVSHWTPDTTHAGLICLSVLAQQRQAIELPQQVFKAIMSINGIGSDIRILRERYQVSKLTLGLVLGVLQRQCKGQDTYPLSFVTTVIEGRLMTNDHISTAVKAILSSAADQNMIEENGADNQGQLADLILRLVDSQEAGALVQEIIKGTEINMEIIEAKLQVLPRPASDVGIRIIKEVESEEVAKPTPETFEDVITHIPTRTAYELSFLSHSNSYVFESLANAFSLASSSPPNLGKFSELAVLRKSLAMTEPLFLSFFVRYWCGPYPGSSRSAAIISVKDYLSDVTPTADLQVLIPYVLYALADPVVKVRNAAIELVLKLDSFHVEGEHEERKSPSLPVLGTENIYGSGSETTQVAWLSAIDASRLIKEILKPSLEECRQDRLYISRVLADSLVGSIQLRKSQTQQKELKKSSKAAILTTLCSHILHTPLYAVKSRLLSMIDGISKVGGTSKSKLLLPLLLAQKTLDEKILKDRCNQELVDYIKFLDQVSRIVAPEEKDGIRALQDIITEESAKISALLRKAVFHRLCEVWEFIKVDTQLSIATSMLDLAIGVSTQYHDQEAQTEALEALRAVKLSSATLSSFLENRPAVSECPVDESPNAKRRRTIHGHVDIHKQRNHIHSTDYALKYITIVLELVEGSKAGTAPHLMKDLFQILTDLQHSKPQIGTDSAYLQSLILGCLNGILEHSRKSPNILIDRSAVRADLIIDCFRTTTSPQVQQAALLLMSSLASVSPELIIHSVMPIFTFMSTNILRQSDDYSIHVVDQTIESVIPPLVRALHKQKGGPLAGASELLLSFVAAFEHVPIHRRKGLFLSLVEKLGPEEFLFVLLILLLDRYAQQDDAIKFSRDFIGHYSALVQLTTMEKYLDVVLDSLKPKPTVSNYLLNSADDRTQASMAYNLLLLLPQIFGSQKLVSKLAKALSIESTEAHRLRRVYSRIVEQTILLADQTHTFKKLPEACDQVLDATIGLLTLQESIISLQILLDQGNYKVRRQVLKSLEHKITSESAGNITSQKACIALLPQLTAVLEESSDLFLKYAVVSCIDRILEKYGKKDVDSLTEVMRVVAGGSCLAADDSRLRVMAILCIATSAEILGEAIISIIPQSLPKAIEYLGTNLQEEQIEESLHNAAYSLFGALFLYIPWIVTGQYLDQILRASQVSATADLPPVCNESRIEVLNLIAKHSGAQECFASLSRTWNSAVTEGPQAIKETLSVFHLALERHSKSAIAKHSQILLDLFLKAFDLRYSQCTPRTEDSYDENQIDEFERLVNENAITMIYKLNDSNFRPFFSNMVEWATAPATKKERQQMQHRQITWYTFLHTFFDTLQSIVTGYASFMLDDVVAILNDISFQESDSKLLWKRVIAALHAAFEHDQDDFWQSPSHFSAISGPLITQFTHATQVSLVPDLIPCISALAVAANSPDHHKSLNSAIMVHMRSNEAAVRLAAVQCEMGITEKLGEEWLGLLPEMLPFISELQEDDDEKVEREVGKWILQIEGILGESLDSMLL